MIKFIVSLIIFVIIFVPVKCIIRNIRIYFKNNRK